MDMIGLISIVNLIPYTPNRSLMIRGTIFYDLHLFGTFSVTHVPKHLLVFFMVVETVELLDGNVFQGQKPTAQNGDLNVR